KRKKGLMKKVNELATLCGINACAIIYSPYDSNPEVWLSDSGVQRIVSDFWIHFSDKGSPKASEHLKKQKKDNKELEMTQVMFQCLIGNTRMFHLNVIDLNNLSYLIEKYLKDINRRIKILENAGMEMSDVGASTTTAPDATIHELGSSSSPATAAAFFNPTQHHHQQQCRHPAFPNIGFYEQNLNLNLNQNHNQNQQWFIEMMNHSDQTSFAVEHISFPFMDDNHRNHHHQWTFTF
ncbi:hypothetical protein EUTSA_v10027038mg, partial [Eutrema salsugineum]